jgi:hypothetical protein
LEFLPPGLDFLPPDLDFLPTGLEFLPPSLEFLPSGLEPLPCGLAGRPRLGSPLAPAGGGRLGSYFSGFIPLQVLDLERLGIQREGNARQKNFLLAHPKFPLGHPALPFGYHGARRRLVDDGLRPSRRSRSIQRLPYSLMSSGRGMEMMLYPASTKCTSPVTPSERSESR